jgi:hypothetical protein
LGDFIPTLGDGIERSVAEFIIPLFSYPVISYILGSFGLGWAILIINLISIVGIIEIIHNMEYWSIAYLLGFIFGIIFITYQFMEWWEILLYIVVGGLFLSLKLKRRI